MLVPPLLLLISPIEDLSVSNNKFDHITAYLNFNDIGNSVMEYGQEIRILLQDDFSYVNEHYFTVTVVEI